MALELPAARWSLLEAINDAVKEGTLPRFDGFEGAELADSLRIVEDFVNGINRTL